MHCFLFAFQLIQVIVFPAIDWTGLEIISVGLSGFLALTIVQVCIALPPLENKLSLLIYCVRKASVYFKILKLTFCNLF